MNVLVQLEEDKWCKSLARAHRRNCPTCCDRSIPDATTTRPFARKPRLWRVAGFPQNKTRKRCHKHMHKTACAFFLFSLFFVFLIKKWVGADEDDTEIDADEVGASSSSQVPLALSADVIIYIHIKIWKRIDKIRYIWIEMLW